MKLEEMIKKYGPALDMLTKLADRPEEKAVGDSAGWGGLFGSGGIASVAGLEPDVLTAHITPTGLLDKLPRFPSIEENPLYYTITGITDVDGAEPAAPCDDAPAGYMKGCALTAAFGRVSRSTQTIDITKVMKRINRGVFTDLLVRGRMLGMPDILPGNMNQSQILSIWTMAEMVQVGVQLERKLNVHTFQGDPANNNVGGGYREFPGLSRQVATGQVDAITNQACASLDSDIKDFNYNPIGGTNPAIVTYLSMLEYYLFHNAERMGMLPWTAAIVLRSQAWHELSEIWPCQYNTGACASSLLGTSSTLYLQGTEMVTQRDALRTRMELTVNGRTYPVIIDDGIFEHNNINNGELLAGQYASSIYFVPLTIQGGFPVTYLEYADFTQAQPDIALLKNMETFWTDKGMYMWALDTYKYCIDLQAVTEMRVILRTPQLAGRIDNVMYEPLQHVRESDPDSPYFADGGPSIRARPTYYSVWDGSDQVR